MTRARDLSNLIGSGNYTSTTFTATAGQTVFTIAHTQGFIQVFMNGLLLDETTDYTSNGTAVTLTEAATADDELEVVKYNTFSVGDAITQTDADTRYVNSAGDTMTGNLIVDGSVSLNASDGVSVSRGSSHSNTYEGGRVTLKNGSGYTKQYGLDTYYENFRIFRENADGTGGAIRFEIDAEGRVKIPNQPSFIAHKSNNNSINGVLSWTTLHQTGNHFNGTRFTAPVSGRYHFDFGGITHNVTNYFYIGFRINGASGNGNQQGATWRHLPQTTGGYNNMHTSAVFHLNANDYVEAATGFNGGSPHLEQYRTSFSGHLIG